MRICLFPAIFTAIVCASRALSCPAATLTVDVADARGRPLADAVVYVYPASGKAPLKASPAAIIDQVDKQFVPLVSVLQTGTVVRFPNKDNIRHQVYSFSPAKRFELRLYSGERAEPVVFDRPGLVVLGCNIHDLMVGYVLVVDTPWFAKSDEAGHAQVIDLPPGEYKASVWHYDLADEASALRQSVRLTGDLAIKATLGVNGAR